MNDFIDYCFEAHGILTFTNDDGFVQYTLQRVDKDPKGLVMDIIRIYVKKDRRGSFKASNLVDSLLDNVKKDVDQNDMKIRRLFGHIHERDGAKEPSLKAQLKYGFKIAKLNEGNILLVKEL